MQPDGETLPISLTPGGWLRAVRIIFDGVATTGGPFYHERKRYRRAGNQQIRCSAVWDRRCQRKLHHDGLHWWRHRKRDAWWNEPDPPFSVIHQVYPGSISVRLLRCTLAGVADGESEFVGVPWRDWVDTQMDVARLSVLTAIALAVAGLLLLTLVRKGVLSWSDLVAR